MPKKIPYCISMYVNSFHTPYISKILLALYFEAINVNQYKSQKMAVVRLFFLSPYNEDAETLFIRISSSAFGIRHLVELTITVKSSSPLSGNFSTNLTLHSPVRGSEHAGTRVHVHGETRRGQSLQGQEDSRYITTLQAFGVKIQIEA